MLTIHIAFNKIKVEATGQAKDYVLSLLEEKGF